MCLFVGVLHVCFVDRLMDFLKFLVQLLQMKCAVQPSCVQVTKCFQTGWDVLKSGFHHRQFCLCVPQLKVTSESQLIFFSVVMNIIWKSIQCPFSSNCLKKLTFSSNSFRLSAQIWTCLVRSINCTAGNVQIELFILHKHESVFCWPGNLWASTVPLCTNIIRLLHHKFSNMFSQIIIFQSCWNARNVWAYSRLTMTARSSRKTNMMTKWCRKTKDLL